MTRADYVFVRPNGKPYRPRITHLRAQSWENCGNYDEEARGVLVLGTLNPDEARVLAWTACNSWYGDADHYVLTQAKPGWWRDSYAALGRAWVEDEDRGAPGVMFTWAEADVMHDMSWCGFCLIPVPRGQAPAHKPNCPTL